MAAEMMPTSSAGRLALLIGGGATTIASIVFFEWPQWAWAVGLGWAMVAITLSDARRFIVPDTLSLPAIPAGLIAAIHLNASELGALPHIAGMLLGATSFFVIRLVYDWLRGRQGLGMGDVKLAAVAGAWTGIDGLLLVVLVASLSALVLVVIVIVLQILMRSRSDHRITPQTAIPFGAFLAPAIWFVYIFRELS